MSTVTPIKAPAQPKVADRIRGALNGWFSPGQPVQPSAPAGTEVRTFDYPTTVNVDFTRRKDEAIGFRELRFFGEQAYLMRAIIEKTKDRICAKPWQLKLRSKPGEMRQATVSRSLNDGRIKKLTALFSMPDGEHTWSKWLRMLLEDQIVIDALSAYVQRTRGGDIWRILPVDGATINRIIDMQGMTPQPPQPAYQQIIKGYPALNLTTANLLYLPYNPRPGKLFGYSPVEQTYRLCATAIMRTVWQQNYYDESNVPAGFIPFPLGENGMSTDEAAKFMRWLNSLLKGNLEERSRLFPIPDTSKGVQLIKQEDQHQLFDEWIARVFAYCLGESPTPFVKQNNRATAQQADDTREEAGEIPLLNSVVDMMNLLLNSSLYFGVPDIEFEWGQTASVNSLQQAQIDQINVTIGTRTVDELRERDGLSPIPKEEEADPNGIEPPPDKKPPEDGGPPAPETNPETAKIEKRSSKKKLILSAFRSVPGRKRNEAIIQTTFEALFEKEAPLIADALSKAYAKVTKASQPDQRLVDSILLEASLSDWSSIVPAIEQSLDKVGQAANGWVFAQLDIDTNENATFDQVNQSAADYASERAAAMVGMRWVNGNLVENPDAHWAITETTRENLRELITQAFTEGMSPRELAQAILDSETFSKSRALTIAQTEVGLAQMDANVHSAIAVGMEEKSVLTSNEGPCIVCGAFAALGKVAMNYQYEPGVLGPLFHPRCRCDLATWEGKKVA